MELDKIYNEDCMVGMLRIPDKSVDMICCDLPYGTTQNKADIVLPFDELWKQYERVIKDDGAIVLFGQGLFYVDLVNSNRKLFRYDLVWDKQLTSGFLNANRMPLRQHEQIAVFYKKMPKYNPQYTQGKPLHGKGKAYKEKDSFKNENYGKFSATEDTRKGSTEKYPTSILKFRKSHPSKSRHRTEKSVDLVEWLVRTYTDEGETVLDNCIGCGTTAVACVRSGRHFIGFETDLNYWLASVARVADEMDKVNNNKEEGK